MEPKIFKDAVLHSCGHTTTRHLPYPMPQREAKRRAHEHNLCADCARTIAEADEEHLAKREQELQLGNLTGTLKQIDWGRHIRCHLMTVLESRTQYCPEEYQEAWRVVLGWCCVQRRASFWINQKQLRPGHLLAICPYVQPLLPLFSEAFRAYFEKQQGRTLPYVIPPDDAESPPF